ncbi:hypothetical protein GW17_00060231, partial [Ensete ventricosum]
MPEAAGLGGSSDTKAPYKGAFGDGQGQPEREASDARKGRQAVAGAVPVGRSVARRYGRLRPARRGGSHLQRGACKGKPARRGGSRLQRGARKGGRLQGARKGLPPAASSTANRGDGANRRGGRPLVGQLPAGKGNRRLRRGSSDGCDTKGERGVRASFGEKDDPAPINLRNFENCP